jgi:hypothetical protein
MSFQRGRIMKKMNVVPVVAALALGFTAVTAGADMKKVAMVRMETETLVAASPAVVWEYMVTGKNFVTWCPVWKSDANQKVHIKKIGDVLEFMDEWGNGGRSVVTFIEPLKELRVAHEPGDGSYVCQSKLLLSEAGGKTKVVFVEQYTDERSDEEIAATAKDVEGRLAGTLQALKTAVEAK